MDAAIIELQRKLGQSMPEKRFQHTLSVAYLTVSLAMCYKEDVTSAMLAGLLHDCAKCLPDAELLKQCKKYQLPMSDVELRNPYLLHGKLGASFAEHHYKIKEKEILNAIIYHTTGRPNMNFLEKAVFLADYLELSRKQPTVPPLLDLRALAFQDIDQTVYLVLKNMVDYLKGRQGEMDKTTAEAMTYYENLMLQRQQQIGG